MSKTSESNIDYDNFERKIDLKLIMAILATGLMSFIGVVVETAMNVTFPTLMEQFSIDTSTVQWITTGYLLVLAIVIPTSPFFKKKFTTRTLFTMAIILFIVGIILDATAPTFSILLIGRIVQGIGTGIALPLMFNIILEQVPFDKMGFMMGIGAFITSIAPAVGPTLGGVVVDAFGWRMIFVVLLPLLIISFFLGIFSINQTKALGKINFDWLGYILIAISFACLVFGTSTAGEEGWTNIKVIILIIAFLVAMFAFYKRSLSVENPVINMDIFKCKTFTFSLLVILMGMFISLGLGYIIPNYVQIVLGKTAAIAGMVMLPGAFLGAVLAPLGGRVLDKIGAKKPILIGNTVIIIATLTFSIMAENLVPAMIVGIYLVYSFGIGFTVGNSMTNGLQHLTEDLNPDGNAVVNTIMQLAGAIGTSIVTSIVAISEAKYADDSAAGMMYGSRNSFYLLFILGILILSCSLLAFYYSKKNKQVQK